MSSKAFPLMSPGVAVKRVVLDRDSDSEAFITLRVKPDRRRRQLKVPAAAERRRPPFSEPRD